jgi:hypothetical protein
MRFYYYLCCISLLVFNVSAYSQDVGPPNAGNFILPGSQAPGPLISFGQIMVDKDETQLYLSADQYKGNDKSMIDVIPSVAYGLRDNFSIYFVAPIAARYQQGQQRSSGLEDTLVQLEYAFYAQSTYAYTDQATVVGNFSIPTGSSTATPNTGIGALSYFIGTTFNRTYLHWFLFTSYGAIFPTANHSDHNGNQYLYQAGVGRNLFDIGTDWIFAAMVEADGAFTERNKISGVADQNSGGNIIYVTPSIWISSKHLIFQLGAGMAPVQNLFGTQPRTNYLISGYLAWSFYA